MLHLKEKKKLVWQVVLIDIQLAVKAKRVHINVVLFLKES